MTKNLTRSIVLLRNWSVQ